MRSYIDQVLALLPFEPAAYRRHGGPPCTYVGHPLTEQVYALRPRPDELRRRNEPPPVLLVLPGSRRSEIDHHMAVFGATLGALRADAAPIDVVLPTMPYLTGKVTTAVAGWPLQPRIVVGEEEKQAAFRVARASAIHRRRSQAAFRPRSG